MKIMDIAFTNLFPVSQQNRVWLAEINWWMPSRKGNWFYSENSAKTYMRCLAKKQNVILKPLPHAITTML